MRRLPFISSPEVLESFALMVPTAPNKDKRPQGKASPSQHDEYTKTNSVIFEPSVCRILDDAMRATNTQGAALNLLLWYQLHQSQETTSPSISKQA
jgi:hypothetical protein